MINPARGTMIPVPATASPTEVTTVRVVTAVPMTTLWVRATMNPGRRHLTIRMTTTPPPGTACPTRTTTPAPARVNPVMTMIAQTPKTVVRMRAAGIPVSGTASPTRAMMTPVVADPMATMATGPILVVTIVTTAGRIAPGDIHPSTASPAVCFQR
jgi:hypothetical protein